MPARNRAELAAFIRFQLSQMSSHNAHHQFEELALEVAKLRIASNLIPATGPVQTGGDHGRDFESFRTYLAGSALSDSTFAAMASGEIIVGACTLNKKIIPKIKSDLKSIFSGGHKSTHVVYFCEADVPVVRRHNLQKLCSDSYGAQLDIFDGQAVADMLARPDTFWIAERHLSVPSELWPQEEVGEGYSRLKGRWLDSDPQPQNYADFLEIKLGVRTATFEESAKPDLSRWILKMRTFTLPAFTERLNRKAHYEISVAELRGHGSLDPAAEDIQAYFASISPNAAPAELLDAAVLIVYSRGALAHGHATIARDKISAWEALVREAVRTALKETNSGGARCFVLTARAMIEPFPAFEELKSDTAKDRYLARWQELVREIKKTPYYSTRDVARILEQLAPIFGAYPAFRLLTKDVDKLVGERAGAAAAADLARRRAVAHFDAEQYVEAISELHEATIQWFTGETMDASILSMLVLSEAYERLGLHYAARYYAAGALFLAVKHEDDETKKRIADAHVKVSDTFYSAGEGLTFLYCTAEAMAAHDAVSSDAYNWERHPQVQRVAAHAAILRAVLKRIAPELLFTADEAIAEWSFSKLERAAFIELSEGEPWRSLPVEQITKRINEDLGQHPFNDLGPERVVTWSALGITWSVRSSNDAENWHATAELVATLQITQVDFANLDLVIVPSAVQVEVQVDDVDRPIGKQLPDNGRLIWQVRMPRVTNPENDAAAAAVAIATLAQATALPERAFKQLVDARFQSGLSNRLFSVRPARELLAFVQPEKPTFGQLAKLSRVDLDVSPLEPPQLRWRNGPGPGYSKDRATSYLKNRYRATQQSIRKTLPRLLSDAQCRKTIRELRGDGLLDWQILAVIANLVANEQLNFNVGSGTSFAEMRERLFQRINEPESDDARPFEMQKFTLETARMLHRINAAAALTTWDLANHRQTPDFDAIKRLLDARYGHSTDDIPHEDPFPGI